MIFYWIRKCNTWISKKCRDSRLLHKTLYWKPIGKRPRGGARKIWVDDTEEDPNIMRVQEWSGIEEVGEDCDGSKKFREIMRY